MLKEEIIETIMQLKDGDKVMFSPKEDATPTIGEIAIVKDEIFVCQNEFNGMTTRKEYKKGYIYSWIIKDKYLFYASEVYEIKMLAENKQFLLF